MTFTRTWTLMVWSTLLLVAGTRVAVAAGVDADTMIAGLQTANRNEEAYITYVVTLRDQGRLTAKLVESTFLWARRKPAHKKFQYFKNGLITQAARQGIRLPTGTPDLRSTATGRVVLQILMMEIPVANATVSIRGTKRTTTTNAKGEFSFANVPLGTFTLDAKASILLVSRTGSAKLILPSTPPSTEAAFVKIRFK